MNKKPNFDHAIVYMTFLSIPQYILWMNRVAHPFDLFKLAIKKKNLLHLQLSPIFVPICYVLAIILMNCWLLVPNFNFLIFVSSYFARSLISLIFRFILISFTFQFTLYMIFCITTA